jgi:lipopolysaccharide export system ATP-binding protein
MKLRTDEIKKSYKGRQVVKGVTVEVNQGEIVGLLGPNGAGTTTSFYMMVGLVRPNEGHVYLDDIDITHHAMYKRAQLGIGYLPQEVSVFRKMSVEDNIMTVLEMTDMDKKERKEKLESLLEEFGLKHVRKNLGQSLSGGEKRRTEIARALATNPKFILLDEPFAGVDPIAVEDIQKIVYKLKKKNIGVLITDHNVQETLSITDRTYLLFEGNILREGTAEDLAADEMVRKVYLGANFILRKNKVDDDDESLLEKTDEEKQNEAIQKLMVTTSGVQRMLGGWMMNSAKNEALADLEEDALRFQRVFENVELGDRANAVIKAIKLEPISHYKAPINLNNYLAILYLLIPVIGWGLFFLSRSKLKLAQKDVDEMARNLESFKYIFENPEIENLID